MSKEWIEEGSLVLHDAATGKVIPVKRSEVMAVRDRPEGGTTVKWRTPTQRGSRDHSLAVKETIQEVSDQMGSGLPARWLDEE